MAKKQTETITQKSLGELKTYVKELRGALLKFQLEHAKRTLKNTRSLTLTRKLIAQALTAIKEKEVTK